MNRPQLPSRRDWARVALLAIVGGLLGILLNAVNPHGIDVRIAYGFPAADAGQP